MLKHLTILITLLISVHSISAQGTEYLIITTANYYEEIKPLAEWKREKGYDTQIVLLENIGTTAEEIKKWIDEYYKKNSGLKFLLMGGSHWDVPALKEYGRFSDYSYSCPVEVNKTEFAIGRFPAHSKSDMVNMVKKTIKYDKDPDSGSWYKHVVGQSDVPLKISTDTNYDAEILQFHRSNIKLTNFLTGEFEKIAYPASKQELNYEARYFYWIHPHNTHPSPKWESFDFYNSKYKMENGKTLPSELSTSLYKQGKDEAKAVDPYFKALNDWGAGIVYINGHGSPFQIGLIGSYYLFEQNQLDNGNKTPFCFFAGCSSGQYDSKSSDGRSPKKNFATEWITHANGAVGVIAASANGISGSDDELFNHMFDGIWDDFMPDYHLDQYEWKHRPAEALRYGKEWAKHVSYWQSEKAINSHNRTFMYLGDPELMIRTQSPLDFTVNLQVEDKITIRLNEKALISLYDGNKIYKKTAKEAVFNLPNGSYKLTITAHNYKPFTKDLTLDQAAPEKFFGYEKIVNIKPETDKSGDMQFGNSVATCDGYLAIGAEGSNAGKVRSGAVYIFKDDQQIQRITNENPVLNQSFGHAMAMDGNYLLIGAPGSDNAQAFIYKKGTEFRLEQELEKPNSDIDFGESVAIKGSYAMVGAPDKKSVYIYKKDDQWKLIKTITKNQSSFGERIDYDGSRLIVSAPSGNSGYGMISIYKQNNDDFDEEISINGSTENESLGKSVLVSGDYAFVGCRINPSRNIKVYQYTDKWKEIQVLSPRNKDVIYNFSSAIHFDGNILLIGGNDCNDYRGTFEVFQEKDASFERIDTDDTNYSNGERAGSAIAADHENIYIGAPNRFGNNNFGAVYKFRKICPKPDYSLIDNDNGTAKLIMNTEYSNVLSYKWSYRTESGYIKNEGLIKMPRGRDITVGLKSVCGDQYESLSVQKQITLKALREDLIITEKKIKELSASFVLDTEFEGECFFGVALKGAKKPDKSQLKEGNDGDNNPFIWKGKANQQKIVNAYLLKAYTEYELFVCIDNDEVEEVFTKSFRTVDLKAPEFHDGYPMIVNAKENTAQIRVYLREECKVYWLCVKKGQKCTDEQIKKGQVIVIDDVQKIVKKSIKGLSKGTDYNVHVIAVDRSGKETKKVVAFKTTGTPVETIAVPKNVKCSKSGDQLELSWDKVDQAKGYIVDSNGNQQKTSKNSFVLAAENKKFIFKVAAESENGVQSAFSEALKYNCVTELGIPGNLKIKELANSIVLSWDEVKDADYYIVDSNGNQQKANSNSFVLAAEDKEFIFKVAAASENGVQSAFSEALKYNCVTKLGIPVNLKIQEVADRIILSWDEVKDVDYYIVDSNGSQQKANSNSFALAAEDKEFIFKVAAASENGVQSAFSEALKYKCVMKLSIPVNLKIQEVADSIILSWDKVKGADYYLVDTNGKVRNCSVNRHSELLENKEFNFKVAASKKDGTQTDYSETISRSIIAGVKHLQFQAQEMLAYPNPTRGIVNIKNADQVEVFTISGQKILSLQNCSQINLSDHSAGIYFLRVRRDGKYQTLKIMKK